MPKQERESQKENEFEESDKEAMLRISVPNMSAEDLEKTLEKTRAEFEEETDSNKKAMTKMTIMKIEDELEKRKEQGEK